VPTLIHLGEFECRNVKDGALNKRHVAEMATEKRLQLSRWLVAKTTHGKN